MILVEGGGHQVNHISLTRNGKRIILSELSDPKDLFAALAELARFIASQKRKDPNK